MNKDLTEIAYILDRSGSMQNMVEPAIAGFNQFIQEQIAATGFAHITLVLFDDEYLVTHQSVPVEEVPKLDTTTYVPRGMTALLDAIGKTIVNLGKRLAAIPEAERPGQVIVAIFTDGAENVSTEFDIKKISSMIKHQREKYNWKFLFLAANQDAIATATKMGIDRKFSSAVSHSGRGVYASSASISRTISSMRHFSSTGQEDANYGLDMQDIVSEEEAKNIDK